MLQQQWFISGTKVCRNFYLRAQGIVLSTVKKYSKEIFSTKGNSQTGLGEQYHKNKPCSRDFADRARKTYEIVTWMKLFAKHVGDKLPDEDIAP